MLFHYLYSPMVEKQTYATINTIQLQKIFTLYPIHVNK